MVKASRNQFQVFHIFYMSIIVLLVVVAVLAFFLGKNIASPVSQVSKTPSEVVTQDPTEVIITVIDDVRCSECQTQMIVDQIKAAPFLSGATYRMMDFSEEGTADLMKEHGIVKLPAILLNSNKFSDQGFLKYLEATPAGLYSLNIGAIYDPYLIRSERGFVLLPEWILDQIQKNSHIYGSSEAEILWVEYSDMNCGYCAKMHNEGTHDAVFTLFGDKLAFTYQYFAIFNREAPEVFECIAEQKGSDVMYKTIEQAYKQEKKDVSGIAGLVDGLDRSVLDTCVASKKFTPKVDLHMKIGKDVFGITGTPGNILINTRTGEYQTLPGAYPVSEFERVINSLFVQK